MANKENKENKEIISCLCRVCKRVTNHEVLFCQPTHSDDSDYWWEKDYMIVKCCGCDAVDHCDAVTEEGNIDYDEDGYECMLTAYNVIPNPETVVEPIDIYELPIEIKQVYKETIDCINRGNLILAGAGCRAIIEAVCHEQNILKRPLETMINNLATQRIITKNDRDHLHAIRFMGNASIHDVKAYDIKELIIVAKIINTILTSLYIIHEEFQKLKDKPVTSFEEFKRLLNKKLDSFQPGETGNLDLFLKGIHNIIKEDRREFEQKLIEEIKSGVYTRLELVAPIKDKSSQRYKIITTSSKTQNEPPK